MSQGLANYVHNNYIFFIDIIFIKNLSCFEYLKYLTIEPLRPSKGVTSFFVNVLLSTGIRQPKFLTFPGSAGRDGNLSRRSSFPCS